MKPERDRADNARARYVIKISLIEAKAGLYIRLVQWAVVTQSKISPHTQM